MVRREAQFVPICMSTSTRCSKYVVNQKLEHVDDISLREHFGRIRMFSSQNKFCPFLGQGICIYV